jgi:virginiamycin B lyase
MKLKLFLVALAAGQAVLAQTAGTGSNVPRPGVKELQVPFASLKSIATFKIGKTADWVLITDGAVWVASTKPNSIQRINPATNKVVAKVDLTGKACSGLAIGFGSVWVPLCGGKPLLARVDAVKNKITAVLPLGPAGPEGGITVSGDSVWMVTDEKGTLVRIDPDTGTVRQKIPIPPGSYNPLFSDGIIWITGFESSVLTAIDAVTGEVLVSIPVGPKPRFLTSGGGSVWTLNQGDGTVSRVDEKSRKLTSTITVGIPGLGGDICYGADSVWTSVFDVPLTWIDSQSNKVLRQWVGSGGDSVRFGHDSIWLTDYHKGLIWRFPYAGAQSWLKARSTRLCWFFSSIIRRITSRVRRRL